MQKKVWIPTMAYEIIPLQVDKQFIPQKNGK